MFRVWGLAWVGSLSGVMNDLKGFMSFYRVYRICRADRVCRVDRVYRVKRVRVSGFGGPGIQGMSTLLRGAGDE